MNKINIRLALTMLVCVAAAMTAGAAVSDTITTINDIARMEGVTTETETNINRLNGIWGKDTYFNIVFNSTKLSSKELPSPDGAYALEFKNDFGIGIQSGHTYRFHKNPLGRVLFFGLDFTWADINFNTYKAVDSPVATLAPKDGNEYMPWHHKKVTLDYGMSLGPSLTLYPFTPLHNDGADKIRLHAYFHLGYAIQGAMIKDVEDNNEYAFGHGLFTSFGLSLTWNFIGLGYEHRNDGNMKYKHVAKAFDTGKMKFKQSASRVYIQFRF